MMSRRLGLSPDLRLGGGASAAIALPFSDDFNRDDAAALGSFWSGAGAIVSQKAVITPSLGSDLFDAGKGTFDSGTNDWVAVGGNSIANDAGALKVTFVDNGAGASCIFRATNVLASDLVVGQWYRCQLDVWVNSGSCRVSIVPTAGTSEFVTATTPTTITLDFLCTTATGHGITFVNLSAGEIVWVDNITLKPITHSSMIAALPATSENVNGKVAVTQPLMIGPAGFIGWMDSATDPQNYLLACHTGTTNGQAQLWKRVNGAAPTRLLNVTTTYVAGGMIEIRRTDATTFQLWYAGSQIGANQTISDASIVSNQLHGMLSSSGANNLDSFLLEAAA